MDRGIEEGLAQGKAEADFVTVNKKQRGEGGTEVGGGERDPDLPLSNTSYLLISHLSIIPLQFHHFPKALAAMHEALGGCIYI